MVVSNFSGKKRYEGVRFNVITIMRGGWVFQCYITLMAPYSLLTEYPTLICGFSIAGFDTSGYFNVRQFWFTVDGCQSDASDLGWNHEGCSAKHKHLR